MEMFQQNQKKKNPYQEIEVQKYFNLILGEIVKEKQEKFSN